MKHLVLDDCIIEGNYVIVSGKKYHYIKNVRRFKIGDEVKSLINKYLYTLVLDKIKDGKIYFNIKSRENARFVPFPEIIVIQSLLKSKKMDNVVRALGELGVKSFYPVHTNRSVGRLNVGDDKFARWKRLANESAKISGIERSMNINPPMNLEEVLAEIKRYENDNLIKLLFSTRNGIQLLKYYLLDNKLVTGNVLFILIFGPEGGFDQSEEKLILKKGFVPVSMGNFVMRSETASIVGTGFIRLFSFNYEGNYE